MRDLATTVSHKWFGQVWNDGDRNAIGKLLTEDTVAHGLGPDGKTVGVAAFESFYDDFRSQFTNVKVAIGHVMVEDNMESVLNHVTATHIESGKDVAFTGICMSRIEDGRIAEAWNVYDFLTMYQQVGYTLAMQ